MVPLTMPVTGPPPPSTPDPPGSEGLKDAADSINFTPLEEHLEKFLNCAVCLDTFKEPKILPCQHTFCAKPCLSNLVDRSSRILRCPECRERYQLPPGGISELPLNRIVMNLLDITQSGSGNRAADSTRSKVKKCVSCRKEANPAEGSDAEPLNLTKCLHCSLMVCDSCKVTHMAQLKFDVTQMVSQIRQTLPTISQNITSLEGASREKKTSLEKVRKEMERIFNEIRKRLDERESAQKAELASLEDGALRSIRLVLESVEVDLATYSSFCQTMDRALKGSVSKTSAGDDQRLGKDSNDQEEAALTESELVTYRQQCQEYLKSIQERHRDNASLLPNRQTTSYKTDVQGLYTALKKFGQIVTKPEGQAASANERSTTPSPNRNVSTRGGGGHASTESSPRGGRHTDPPPTGPVSSRSRGGGLNRLGGTNQSPAVTRGRAVGRQGYGGAAPRDTAGGPARRTTSRPTVGTGGGGTGLAATTGARQPSPSPVRVSEEDRRRGAAAGRNPSNPLVITEASYREYRDNIDNLTSGSAARSGADRSESPTSDNSWGRGHRLNDDERGNNNNNNSGSSGRFDYTVLGQDNSAVPRIFHGAWSSSNPLASLATGRTGLNTSGVSTSDYERTVDSSNSLPRGSPASDGANSSLSTDRPANQDGSSTSDMATLTFRYSQAASSILAQPAIDYKNKGVPCKVLGSQGSHPSALGWPRGLSVSPINDCLAVADTVNHRVQVFDQDGDFVFAFGQYGDGPAQMDCPVDVSISADGLLAVSDRHNHRVQVFDAYGEFVKVIGSHGNGTGELEEPWGVAFGPPEGPEPRQLLYVSDRGNSRVQVFDSDSGAHVRTIGEEGSAQLCHPTYVCVSPRGTVLVSDSSNNRVQIYDADGSFLGSLGSTGRGLGQLRYPTGMAIDSQDFIVVADSGNSRVQVYRRDGRHYCSFGGWGSAPGQVKAVEGVAINSRGQVIVVDRDNHRIQIF